MRLVFRASCKRTAEGEMVVRVVRYALLSAMFAAVVAAEKLHWVSTSDAELAHFWSFCDICYLRGRAGCAKSAKCTDAFDRFGVYQAVDKVMVREYFTCHVRRGRFQLPPRARQRLRTVRARAIWRSGRARGLTRRNSTITSMTRTDAGCQTPLACRRWPAGIISQCGSTRLATTQAHCTFAS